MVEETIKAVKDAEAKAGEILKAAAQKASDIVEKARADGTVLQEQEVKIAKEAAEAEKTSAREGLLKMLAQDEESDKEIAALKALAAGKESQAIDMIIGQLY